MRNGDFLLGLLWSVLLFIHSFNSCVFYIKMDVKL